jgi:hypothetical protein
VWLLEVVTPELSANSLFVRQNLAEQILMHDARLESLDAKAVSLSPGDSLIGRPEELDSAPNRLTGLGDQATAVQFTACPKLPGLVHAQRVAGQIVGSRTVASIRRT